MSSLRSFDLSENEKHYTHLAVGVLTELRDHISDDMLLSRAIDALASASPSSQLNMLRAIGHLFPATQLASMAPECASYPGVKSSAIRAKLVLNLPVGEGLTKAERHRWLSEGASPEPCAWLTSGLNLPSQPVRLAVSRWALLMCSREHTRKALLKRHRWGSLAEHLSDLTEEDVGPGNGGKSPGVNVVAARRDARLVADEYGTSSLCERPGWLSSLGGRVRLLNTGTLLAAEGREMSHCVGSYASQVESGRSVICAISAFGQRATVEYSSRGELVQIQGPRNERPGVIARHLAALAVNRRTRTHGPRNAETVL